MESPQDFLSYRSSQKAIVEWLAEALRRAGVNPVVDFVHFVEGGNVSAEIIKAIDRSAVIVTLLTKDLLSLNPRESAWVRAEISVARQFGRPVLPVLWGVTPDDVKFILDSPSSESVDSFALDEVKDRLQLLSSVFPTSGPTDADIGALVRKVIETYRQPSDACFNEDVSPRYRRLLPGDSHARVALLSTGIAEARNTMAFGRTHVLVPTDRHGTPEGLQQRELLGTERLSLLRAVTPTIPNFLGPTDQHSTCYVQVTSFDDAPSSTSQRDCIVHARARSL
jgi:hypothetical protein